MAWAEEIIPMVREFIGDTNSAAYRFTDTQLESSIISTSRLVVFDVRPTEFVNNYIISVENGVISPDPTATITYDPDFITLLAMKSACVINQGQAIKAAGQSIRIKDGSSEIDLKDAFRARWQVAESGWCAAYQKALSLFKRDKTLGLGRLVTTPVRPS